MSIRAFFAALSLALPTTAAFAACTGEDIRSLITAEERARIEAETAALPYAEGIAFRAVRGEDTLTMLGTVHLHSPDIPALALSELSDADLLLVEMSDDELLRMQSDFQNPSFILNPPDAPSLDADLTEAEWLVLLETLSALGVPPALAPRLQPWFATFVMAIPPCEIAAQLERPALDMRIALLAEAYEVPIFGLERYEDALAAFIDVPRDAQIDVLKDSIAASDFGSAIVVSSEAMWREEKPQLIMSLSGADSLRGRSQASEDMIDSILDERNQLWMPVILEALETHDDVFVAVGAAHLGGVGGLLVLLEAEGFVITRLDPFAE